jgi:hypothetical protein
MSDDATHELSAEDRKLVTLARATRARTGAAEGAAVRDADGRTYAAATVDLPSLQLSALQVVLTGTGAASTLDLAAVRDLGGPGVLVHVGDPRGTVTGALTT